MPCRCQVPSRRWPGSTPAAMIKAPVPVQAAGASS